MTNPVVLDLKIVVIGDLLLEVKLNGTTYTYRFDTIEGMREFVAKATVDAYKLHHIDLEQ
jgi:hypothetical protein